MKKLLTVLFIFCLVNTYGQSVTGTKTRFPGIWWSSKDTANATTADSIVVLANRGDQSLYFRWDNSGAWSKIGTYVGAGFINNQYGTNLAAQTAKFKISDTGWSAIFRAPKFYGDTIQNTSSAGGKILNNSGSTVAEWGAGGGTNFDFHGFAGYNANRSSSYTDRSFTDKKYVDSSTALYLRLTGGTMTGTLLGTDASFTNSVTAGTTLTSKFLYAVNTGSSGALRINNDSPANEFLYNYGYFQLQAQRDSAFEISSTSSVGNVLRFSVNMNSLTAKRYYKLPDASGTLALSNGSLTNRRIPFANSDGVLKDTTGFTWAASTLSVPGDVTATGVVSASTLSGTISTAAQPNITSLGTLSSLTVSGGISGSSLDVSGTFNLGVTSATGVMNLRNTSAAQATFYGMSDIATNRAGSGKINLGSNGSFQGVLQYYDGGSTILYIDNTFDNAAAATKFRFRTTATPVDALTLVGSGDGTFAGTVTSTQYKLSALNTAPSSASDTGTTGEIRIDANYIYVCTATNTWKRVAISTW